MTIQSSDPLVAKYVETPIVSTMVHVANPRESSSGLVGAVDVDAEVLLSNGVLCRGELLMRRVSHDTIAPFEPYGSQPEHWLSPEFLYKMRSYLMDEHFDKAVSDMAVWANALIPADFPVPVAK